MLSLAEGLDRLLTTLDDFEGEIRIVHGSVTHRLLMRGRTIVAARVAGHFDPVLGRLRARGSLSDQGYREALEAMAISDRRSGELARKQGVDADALKHALGSQLQRALDALRRRVDGTRAAVTLHPRRIQAREIVAFARIQPTKRPPKRPARSVPRHRALARIARELHPDRLMHLSEHERRRRERRLAHLSARLQGL